MKGKAAMWLGTSFLCVSVIYYCMASLTRLIQYLSSYTLI